MACQEVGKMSDDQVRDWVNSFDTVMTDCDGVLWVGAEAIPGSPAVIQRCPLRRI
jgi:phosphoglycolate phosphatase